MCHSSGTKMRQEIVNITDELLQTSRTTTVEEIQKVLLERHRLSVATDFVLETLSANHYSAIGVGSLAQISQR